MAVIDVLTLSGDGEIAAVTAFLVTRERDPEEFFAAFGLPARAPRP